jgi:hypothetical protein
MKKREKKLSLAKETLHQLEEGRDMMFIQGGVELLSCAHTSPSTAGGSKKACC